MSINRDDPKLTAYALGELSEAEAAEVEAVVQKDPALKAEVGIDPPGGGEVENNAGSGAGAGRGKCGWKRVGATGGGGEQTIGKAVASSRRIDCHRCIAAHRAGCAALRIQSSDGTTRGL